MNTTRYSIVGADGSIEKGENYNIKDTVALGIVVDKLNQK